MIDIHAHLTYDLESQLNRARAAGIETSIWLSTRVHPEQSTGLSDLKARLAGLGQVIGGIGDTEAALQAGDAELLAALATYPQARAMWKVPLESDATRIAARVEWAADQRQIVGIGELTPAPGAVADIEPVLRSCLDVADRHVMPVLVHGFAPNTGGDLEDYAGLAGRYPRVPLIVGAFGGMNAMRLIELALARPNLYLDLSSALQVFMVAVALRELPERCLFGSNTPYGDVVASRAVIEAATSDRKLRELVWSENAARLFGI